VKLARRVCRRGGKEEVVEVVVVVVVGGESDGEQERGLPGERKLSVAR
jgi:hypothetical protein